MKIVDLKVLPVSYKLDKPIRWGEFEITKKGAVLVQLFTNDDLYGLGEAGFSIEFYHQLKPIIASLKPMIIGQDPRNIENIWEQMYIKTHQWGRRGIQTYAISGIDIALWDLLGKICNMPLYQILGGYKDRVRAYFAPSLKDSETIVKEAKQAIELGFEAIKLRVGIDKDEDLRIVRRVRETVGDEITLMVDANMSYDLHTAKEMAQKFEEYDIFWFEEPIKVHSLEQYVEKKRALSSNINIRVAGGESLFTKYEFRNLITQNAVNIVQPDCTSVGGLTEARKVATMADAWDILCIPHIACSSFGAVGFAANLHLIGSTPNSPFVEYDPYVTPLREELVRDPIMAEDGYIKIPERPGLGLELNEEALDKYSQI